MWWRDGDEFYVTYDGCGAFNSTGRSLASTSSGIRTVYVSDSARSGHRPVADRRCNDGIDDEARGGRWSLGGHTAHVYIYGA